ncbi:hypothetical protein OG225_02855 [Nocardia sp. NBC_01377]|uniref:hypothetical protein n=1 Tax=Nocardia sp. NBC_01377 TaxID=2903595 RepID=UPI00324C576A
MTASDPRPDMTEVIGNDDLLPLILDTQSAGRRAAVERPAPRGEGSPRPSVRRGTSVGLGTEPTPVAQASLATIPEHAMRWGFLDPIPAHVAVDTLRTSRWTRRARRGGCVARVVLDTPCTLRWIRRAGRGEHAVQVAVDMPCTSRRIRRARRAGYAMSVAVDTPQSRRRTTGLSDRVEPILR